MAYVAEAGSGGMGVNDLLEGGSLTFPSTWPEFPLTGRTVARSSRSTARLDPPYVARLVAALPPIESDLTVAPYLDLLDRALEDRRVTLEEAHALEITASAWGLTREQVVGSHLSYMEALVAVALDDDVITSAERSDLDDVARLLGVPMGTLDGLIVARTTMAT